MDGMLSAFVPGLAWALLDFVWQGLLVGWGAALALGLLRKASPQLRYGVACAALLLCAALPAAGLVQRLLDAGSSDAAFTSTLPIAATSSTFARAAGGDSALIAADRLAGWEQALQHRLPLVMLFWSCGAGALALRMVAGLAWVRRRSHPGQYRADPAWQATLDRLAARFAIARPVRLGIVGDLASPVTAGWWRPIVLLPAALATGMPPHLLEALLAHELAHIKRHDYLVNLVQGTIEIVLFYHPTVWWLSNRIRVEREQIADDLAASMLGEPRRLALALSELDQFQFTTPQLAHAAHGGNLMSRIKRLVRPDTEPLNWKMAVPILGLAAACAAFYAQAQVAPPTPAKPATPAVAAAPAKPAAPSRGERKQGSKSGFNHDRSDLSFALVRGSDRRGTSVSGNGDDWKDIEAAKRTIPGDFLWFRKPGGKAQLVQDPAIIARIIDAWAPLDRLSAVMDEHSKEMDGYSKVMDGLSKQMDAVSNGVKPDDAQTRKFEQEMNRLGHEQERYGREIDRLARKMPGANDAEKARLDREIEQVSRKMEELGRRMEKQGQAFAAMHEKMAERYKPMEEIGEKMHEAGKPMEALGAKMEVIGKQMEQESMAAEKVVRSLIDDAIARGLTTPAP
jgi:beta-lactamase regulating signal transducer with metallopeptidase domain